MRRAFINTLFVLTTLVSAVAASDADANFKAYGAPLFFMFALLVAIGLTYKALLAALANVKANPRAAAPMVGGCFAGILCAFFLQWTSAWAYALVSCLLFYGSVLSLGGPQGSGAGEKVTFGILLAWFLVLVGMPDSVSKGMINHVSSTECNAYYGVRKDKMCKAGWLTFALINATVVIAITFLALFSLVAKISTGETTFGSEGAYVSVPEGSYQPPRGPGDYAATAEGGYQQQ